jgi:hypothetical protein
MTGQRGRHCDAGRDRACACLTDVVTSLAGNAVPDPADRPQPSRADSGRIARPLRGAAGPGVRAGEPSQSSPLAA